MARVVKPGFRDAVARMVRTVPEGQLTTYGDVAAALGSPRVARHVGWALAALPEGTDVPWHRVINAQGRISFRGDDGRGTLQEALLAAEGTHPNPRGIYPLKALRWRFVPDDSQTR